MDSEDLERERGITIHAKDTSIEFEGVRIHLVDTPGHADFGGEVERVLGMVDAVLLLVDAVDGVMPQTRFVLGKALAHGLRADPGGEQGRPPRAARESGGRRGLRPARRARRRRPPARVPGGLRLGQGRQRRALDPDDAAHATCGRCSRRSSSTRRPRRWTSRAPLQFQAVTLGWDDFVGRLVIGRVARGTLRARRDRRRASPETGTPEPFRVTKLFGSRGLERVDLEAAAARARSR